MPTIEVLPSSSTTSGPNWTYSNLPPALAHRNTLPVATRVRATRNNNFENSAARQRQINTRILELENDNYRDVNIPIPIKGKGGRSSNRAKASSTQNMKKLCTLALPVPRQRHLLTQHPDYQMHKQECYRMRRTQANLWDTWPRLRRPPQNPRGYSVRFVGIGGNIDAKDTRCNKFYT
ncbi:uncharacterized protein H6S33_006168 [Morchella sextelata]|uniref:uncharacterized protein n=1 Tax=Morchella sextelata TaxID=1174677 RepID=UPI001D045EC8|nr:uncharacterized protein H6S33_006168 [Morchella sextelata]KAH0614282.1 hypothetical protein H6S33_006168 [Morchella sextelata]